MHAMHNNSHWEIKNDTQCQAKNMLFWYCHEFVQEFTGKIITQCEKYTPSCLEIGKVDRQIFHFLSWQPFHFTNTFPGTSQGLLHLSNHLFQAAAPLGNLFQCCHSLSKIFVDESHLSHFVHTFFNLEEGRGSKQLLLT